MGSVLTAVACGPCTWLRRRRLDSSLRALGVADAKRWVAPIRRAKVIDVYDGDTVTLAAFVAGDPYKFRCRLARIDAPEMRPEPTRPQAMKDAEKRAARISRDALADMALGRLVTVSDVRNEKWGRVLAELTVDGTGKTLSDRMLAAGFALPYAGGTKAAWDWHHFPVKQRHSIRSRRRAKAK